MAINAWPFETDDTTEVQFARLMDALQESGVVTGLTLTAGAGMSVNVATGAILIQGLYVESTAVENVAVAAAHATQRRKDYLVVRRNFTTNAATIVAITGTPTGGGGTLPTLQQDDSIWEHPIGVITVPAAATNLVSDNISERRATLSRGWLVYRNTDERPTPTRVAFGVNITSKQIELFDGTDWGAIQITWSNVTGKPSTYPPTIGAGAGDAVAGNDIRLSDRREPLVHDINSGSYHSGNLAVSKGGTGGATPAAARDNLEALGGVVQTAATADPTTGNYVGRLLIEY